MSEPCFITWEEARALAEKTGAAIRLEEWTWLNETTVEAGGNGKQRAWMVYRHEEWWMLTWTAGSRLVRAADLVAADFETGRWTTCTEDCVAQELSSGGVLPPPISIDAPNGESCEVPVIEDVPPLTSGGSQPTLLIGANGEPLTLEGGAGNSDAFEVSGSSGAKSSSSSSGGGGGGGGGGSSGSFQQSATNGTLQGGAGGEGAGGAGIGGTLGGSGSGSGGGGGVEGPGNPPNPPAPPQNNDRPKWMPSIQICSIAFHTTPPSGFSGTRDCIWSIEIEDTPSAEFYRFDPKALYFLRVAVGGNVLFRSWVSAGFEAGDIINLNFGVGETKTLTATLSGGGIVGGVSRSDGVTSPP